MTWIALEGGEGSGKSTQAALLASALDAVLTREPGGTALGASLRLLLLDSSVSMDVRTEALLMAADRAAVYSSVVAPALSSGRDVVSDRSAWSSLAYQGYGRGLDVEELWNVSDWALQGRWPDIAVLLTVPPEVSGARLAARGGTDRFESSSVDFHTRVAEGYLSLASLWPERWIIIDGTDNASTVSARILEAVRR